MPKPCPALGTFGFKVERCFRIPFSSSYTRARELFSLARVIIRRLAFPPLLFSLLRVFYFRTQTSVQHVCKGINEEERKTYRARSTLLYGIHKFSSFIIISSFSSWCWWRRRTKFSPSFFRRMMKTGKKKERESLTKTTFCLFLRISINLFRRQRETTAP